VVGKVRGGAQPGGREKGLQHERGKIEENVTTHGEWSVLSEEGSAVG